MTFSVGEGVKVGLRFVQSVDSLDWGLLFSLTTQPFIGDHRDHENNANQEIAGG